MAIPPSKPYLSIQKFECIHCGRVHEIQIHDGQQIRKGDVIKPSAGGGAWGKCKFCRKPGLRAITEKEPEKKGPVGWNRRSGTS